MAWHGGTSNAVHPRFTGPYTFAHVPHTGDLAGVDVAFLGVPFDTAAGYRTGGRFGPGAIRAASSRLRPYHEPLGVAPFELLNCVDLGDARIVPGVTETSLARIEAAVAEIVSAGVVPAMLGGDHSCTLAHVRAVAAQGPVAVVVFDAHEDCAPEIMGLRYSHGTWMRRAIEEGLVDVERSILVGLRGPTGGPGERTLLRTELGLEYRTIDEVFAMGPRAIGERIRERVGTARTFVSFDVDVLDPACAPGTGTPEIGGMTTRDAQVALRAIAGVSVVGFDVMEVIPAYDHGELTAIAAAGIAYELLCVTGLRGAR